MHLGSKSSEGSSNLRGEKERGCLECMHLLRLQGSPATSVVEFHVLVNKGSTQVNVIIIHQILHNFMTGAN